MINYICYLICFISYSLKPGPPLNSFAQPKLSLVELYSCELPCWCASRQVEVAVDAEYGVHAAAV